MKEGWKIKKLGDLCTFRRGLTYTKGDEVEYSSKAVLRSNNISLDNTISFDDIKYLRESFTIPNEKKVCKDSLLICMSNGSKIHLGKVVIIENNIDFAFGGFMGLLLPIKDLITPKYLFYALISPAYKNFIKKLSDGANINNLKFAALKDFDILLPDSLKEQQRIVAILDAEFAKIDALKANAEKSLQAAKDLFQSALKQALEPKSDWNVYKLKDVCKEYGDYGMSVPSKPYKDIRYLRITDITEWGELNDDKVSADTNSIDDKYLLQEGDVLFARTGATVGKSLVYKSTMGRCSYAGYLIRYRLNQDMILPQLLFYITHSKSYYDWIKANQKSTTLPNISAKIYNEYEISIPSSLINQKNITTQLDNLDERCKALQENYRKTIALCEDLKQALLRKAFNGEL